MRRSLVFVSHSEKDNAAAGFVARVLMSKGVRVWIDERNVRTGDRLAMEVSQAIERASDFILIWSRNATASSWVTTEYCAALVEYHKRGLRIFSVILDDTPLPNILQTFRYERIPRRHIWRKENRFKIEDVLLKRGYGDDRIARAFLYNFKLFAPRNPKFKVTEGIDPDLYYWFARILQMFMTRGESERKFWAITEDLTFNPGICRKHPTYVIDRLYLSERPPKGCRRCWKIYRAAKKSADQHRKLSAFIYGVAAPKRRRL